MDQHKKLDNKVFSMAAQLFGYPSSQPKKEEDKKAIERPISTVELPNDIICAVYPALTTEAFSATMDAYRQHINVYNFKVEEENLAIKSKNNSKRNRLLITPHNPEQSRYVSFFMAKNKDLSVHEFNAEVDIAEKDHNVLIFQRKIQKVKYASEIIFQNILHLYNSQLMKSNKQFMSFSIQTKRPIKPLSVNSFLVTQLQRDGIKSLDLCSKTVRSHRQRLQEAKVFVDYEFKGHSRGVNLHINASILTVFDMKTSKFVRAENQPLTSQSRKECLDNNESTRTIINKYKIKENVKNISLDKEFPTVTPSNLFFTRTPNAKLNLNYAPAAEKVLPKSENNSSLPPAPMRKINELSNKLGNVIMSNQELAERLANHEFDNYTPIDIRLLFEEAMKGTLTNEEFRQVVLQDFFKNSAKLYRKSSPFVGSWKKAINLYNEHKFISFTGAAFNKSVITDNIQDLRWQLEHARKWFLKHEDFNTLFPNQYFDFSRTEAKEGGFEYTKKALKRHHEYRSKREDQKNKTRKESDLRKENINHSKKMNAAVKRFFRNKLSLPDLMDYVDNNLPTNYREKLSEIIEKESINFKK